MSTKESSSLFKRPWPDFMVRLLAFLRSSPVWYSFKTCCCFGLSAKTAFHLPLPLASLPWDSLFCRRSNILPRRSLAQAIWASRTCAFSLSVRSPGILGGFFAPFRMASSRKATSKQPVKLRSVHICVVPPSFCWCRLHRECFPFWTDLPGVSASLCWSAFCSSEEWNSYFASSRK